MRRPLLSCLLALAPACLGPRSAPDSARVPDEPRAGPAEVQAALAELFPEIEGAVTREAIEAFLAARNRAEGRLGEAAAALAAEEVERAHALLSAEICERTLARGRALFEQGDARGALAVLEQAAAVAPRDPEVLRLCAESALAVGMEDGDPAFLEDALEGFGAAARAGGDARAWIGASLAARELGRIGEAIESAERALHGSGGAIETSVSLRAQRALAQARIDAHAKACADGAPSASSADRFEAARSALETLVERAPADPWGWIQLAILHETRGSLEEARRSLLAGLALAPADPGLHERLASVAREIGGSDAALAAFDELASVPFEALVVALKEPEVAAELFRRARPGDALAWWHGALERFDRAVDGLAAGQDTQSAFREAEDVFEGCRDLTPELAERGLAYEVLCRGGVGWCRLAAEDLEGAHDAFLSMEKLLAGEGLKQGIEGRLGSGVRGLALVADAWYRRGRDANSLERAQSMERATKIFDFLHYYEPEDLGWASKAGQFHRDTAVIFEQRARALARQGGGDREQANRWLARAREMMERAFLAYSDACALLEKRDAEGHGLVPDDVAIHNQAGQILARYLQRDAPKAEEHLMRAVQLGEAQLPAARLEQPGLDAEELQARRDALVALEVALGDAYENLGVLHLTLKGRPGVARSWFQKALLEGGPDPRPLIDGPGGWLERCDRAEAGAGDPIVRDATRWAAPIETAQNAPREAR